MSYTEIKRKQLIKTDIDSLWNFISSPKNLEKITPKWMKFKITSKNEDKIIFPGMIIKYKITPLLNIPLKWVTEITSVKEKVSFIDQQHKGPYKEWIHEHKLESTPKGIIMYDTIKYIPPFGIIGKITNWMFIRRRVNKIFDYRRQVLNEIFHSN
tara:strand:- start:462 stop:926 length:465 start_codon:yes stop_codon:yes gene_type:complete